MTDRPLALLLALAVVPAPVALAGPRITPAATLAPACEAYIGSVLAHEDARALPVRVLADPAPRVGPYLAAGREERFGGQKVDTVLTGMLEYQDGPDRAIAPFFCVGRGSKVAYYYAGRACPGATDRPVFPVRECHAAFRDDARASACVKDRLAQSEDDLASSFESARVRSAQAGRGALEDLERSEQAFLTYRTRSCDVFRARDASTHSEDFFDDCLARLNTVRARTLSGRRAD